MNTELPSMAVVRGRLLQLRDAEIDRLATECRVPASTLRKIRQGVTPNPGFETVRKFIHLLPVSPTEHTHAAQPAEQGPAHA